MPDSNIETRTELDDVLPVVYDQLRKFASRVLRNEHNCDGFQTTELVHEAYVRLAKLDRIEWEDEDHILRSAIGAMRRILIDFARQRKTQKRDSGHLSIRVPLTGIETATSEVDKIDLLALNEAVEKLQKLDPQLAETVELRYFGGQSLETAARLQDVSVSTIRRNWALAKAWLYRELTYQE